MKPCYISFKRKFLQFKLSPSDWEAMEQLGSKFSEDNKGAKKALKSVINAMLKAAQQEERPLVTIDILYPHMRIRGLRPNSREAKVVGFLKPHLRRIMHEIHREFFWTIDRTRVPYNEGDVYHHYWSLIIWL
jgi:hypothetical protein